MGSFIRTPVLLPSPTRQPVAHVPPAGKYSHVSLVHLFFLTCRVYHRKKQLQINHREVLTPPPQKKKLLVTPVRMSALSCCEVSLCWRTSTKKGRQNSLKSSFRLHSPRDTCSDEYSYFIPTQQPTYSLIIVFDRISGKSNVTQKYQKSPMIILLLYPFF